MGNVIELIVSIMLAVAITFITYTSEIKAGTKALEVVEVCEQKLPRDQHCKISAVPAHSPETSGK